MRTMFQPHIYSGTDILETDDHKESWRMHRAQMEDERRDAMDPETELSIRESMHWRSEVDGVLANIDCWLNLFSTTMVGGNEILRQLNRLADQLSKLGWHGDKIPF